MASARQQAGAMIKLLRASVCATTIKTLPQLPDPIVHDDTVDIRTSYI